MGRYVIWSVVAFLTFGLLISCGGGGGGGSSSDNWEEVTKITASDPEAGDRFGGSVSLSGDYLVVGANGEATGGTDAGAAYIFYRDQGGTDNWGEVTRLTALDAEAGDLFGYTASLSGDYLIVGADREATWGTDAGAAYVFFRNQGGADNWGQVAKLTASDAEAGDHFGFPVSISGRFVAVGAYGEDALGNNAGAAYIFSCNQGGADNWGEVVKLTATDTVAGDWFGESVSLSGDYLVVGADGEDTGGSNAGAAYVFNRNQGGADNWGQVTKLTASDPGVNDYFGYTASLSGDYLIVGAYNEDEGGNNAGAAYVFYRDQGGTDNWGEVVKLTASDAEADDWFGYSVSLSGSNAIVGAYPEGDGGAVYLYSRNQGGADAWGEIDKLTASDAEVGDHFGYSVSVSGDYMSVGAYGEDEGGTDAGAAYVFER